MTYHNLITKVILLFIVAQLLVHGQDVAFPVDDTEQETYVNRYNKTRTPLFLPGVCGEGEIYYPGNQESDWVCDCRPGFLYYSKKEACYASHSQGPCKSGEYFHLPENNEKRAAICSKNSCDGKKVIFKDKCVELNRKNDELCPQYRNSNGVLGINQKTMEVDCIPLNKVDIQLEKLYREHKNRNTTIRENQVEGVPVDVLDVRKNCVPGSKAFTKKQCKT